MLCRWLSTIDRGRLGLIRLSKTGTIRGQGQACEDLSRLLSSPLESVFVDIGHENKELENSGSRCTVIEAVRWVQSELRLPLCFPSRPCCFPFATSSMFEDHRSRKWISVLEWCPQPNWNFQFRPKALSDCICPYCYVFSSHNHTHEDRAIYRNFECSQ